MESLTYKRNKVEIPKNNFFFPHLCQEKKKKMFVRAKMVNVESI